MIYPNSKRFLPIFKKLDYSAMPLTFKGKAATNAVQLSAVGSPNTVSLNYKKNNGDWTTYTVGDVIELNHNQTVAFSGANQHFSLNWSNCYRFVMTGTIKSYGNIQSLMNYSDTAGKYVDLFKNCSSLITAPSLPATTLVNGCYDSLFTNCSGLLTAPSLPATTLTEACYWNMFDGCSSLKTAPQLPAIDLAIQCYGHMFQDCSSLMESPELPATGLTLQCYVQMFKDCSSLTSAPQLPASTLANVCYANMFGGCTSLTTVPNLPATTLADYCYENMFEGCTSLSSVPANLLSSSKNISMEAYSGMFANCTSLTTAPELPATELASGCYRYMFAGCSSLVTAPALPATTLADECYWQMFQGCSSLASIEVAFTDWTQANNATNYWVNGVPKIGVFTKPSTLAEEYGTDRIPFNTAYKWTVVNK